MPEKKSKYENNPFFVAVDGIGTFFDRARGVSVILIVVSVLTAIAQLGRDDNNENITKAITEAPSGYLISASLIFLIIMLAIIFVAAMLNGISAYSSAQVARGRNADLGEAFHAVLDKLFSFIWLQIIIGVKVLLWMLLLVIPGIYMAYRYSLANIAFFDKNKRGNDAIKESLKLTKGAWLTTFASQFLFDLMTLGVISNLVSAGSRTVLYRQFTQLADKEKPAAHWLSWVTVFLPLALLALIIMFSVTIGLLMAVAWFVKG